MIRPVLGGCWGEAHLLCACELRAISNGMVTPTLFLWRPVLVHGRTPLVVISDPCTKQIMNLQCGASAPPGAVTLCADVACLEWGWRIRDQRSNCSGRSDCLRSPFETCPAKEAKEVDRLQWKSPRLSCRGEKGITVRTKWQSGCADGRRRALALKGEPPPSATRGAPWGKPTRT